MKKHVLMVLFFISFAAFSFSHLCEARDSYTVQLMAGIDRATAAAFASDLHQRGIETFIEQAADNATAAVWKVRSGIFPEKQKAEKYAAGLKARGFSCWVTTTGRRDVQERAPQEPEALQPQASQPATTSVLPRPAPEPAPSRTYKYFNPDDGAMHITASLATIPAQRRNQIKEIAVYPVFFIALDARDMTVSIAVDREKKRVRLSELMSSSRRIPGACLQRFQESMASARLRLKYDPAGTGPDGTLRGTLFLSSGDSLALDMVRQGIAAHDPDAVSVLEHQRFREAEDSARREKACLWEKQ